jgi:excisionase family DNA binding protein
VTEDSIWSESLIPVTQVAKALKVSPQTVYRMIHRGELEAVPVTEHLMRVREQSVKEVLARRIKPTEAP